MIKFLSSTKGRLALSGVLVLCLLCGLWLFNSWRKTIDNDLDNVTGYSDEFMEGYFDSYAEMVASGEQ